MKDDSSLSSKRIEVFDRIGELPDYVYREEDIKEAVKKLKDGLKEFDYKGLRLEGTYLKLKNKIDKIFGDNLTLKGGEEDEKI